MSTLPTSDLRSTPCAACGSVFLSDVDEHESVWPVGVLLLQTPCAECRERLPGLIPDHLLLDMLHHNSANTLCIADPDDLAIWQDTHPQVRPFSSVLFIEVVSFAPFGKALGYRGGLN